VGVGFQAMGVKALEEGCNEQVLGLAMQYHSTFGKPATVESEDYTKFVENLKHWHLPGSVRPCFQFQHWQEGWAG